MGNDNFYMVDDIPVIVHRKNIKNIYLHIYEPDAPVELSLPRRAGVQEGLDFVRRKRPWIRRKQQELRQKAGRRNRDEQLLYVSGDRLVFWGKPYELVVKNGTPTSFRLAGDKAVMTIVEGSTPADREAVVKSFRYDLMNQYLKKRLPEIQGVAGLYCAKWRLRFMTSRWGSYSLKTRTITLNLNLTKMEKVFTDYVIVHELVHTRVPNHGPEFYAYMDRLMPGWKELRKAMR